MFPRGPEPDTGHIVPPNCPFTIRGASVASLQQTMRLMEKGFGTQCTIDAQRCITARHRKSGCTICMQVCPQDAIVLADGRPQVINALCTGCGACACVCPTQAAQPKGFSDAAIRQAIDTMHAGDTVLFICAESLKRAGSPLPKEPLAQRHKLANGQRITSVTVPCLVRLDECHLLHCAVKRAAEVQLLSTGCRECTVASNEDTIQETMALCRHLCRSWGLDVPVQWISDQRLLDQFAGKLKQESPSQLDRRSAFSQVIDEVKHLAGSVAETQLEQALPAEEAPTLAQILGFADGAMPQAPANRNTALLDDLYSVKASGSEPVEYDHFGKVSVNDDCNDCGICANFCPTGALRQIGQPPQEEKMGLKADPQQQPTLEFRCCDCSGCELCADICPQRAIQVSHQLSCDELFALEPTVLRGPAR